MTNAELIAALRYCAEHEGCDYYIAKDCPRESTWMCGVDCGQILMLDAAAALKEADKRIAELEAQLPKEGEWIEDDTTDCGADRVNYKCSLCGKIGGTWKRGLTQDELPNYCPSCGSRMRGENDD